MILTLKEAPSLLSQAGWGLILSWDFALRQIPGKYCAIKNSVKIWRLQIFSVSLHKISGTRQFESKLSLHSLAKSLHKI